MVWIIIGVVVSIALIITAIIYSFRNGDSIKEKLLFSLISLVFAVLFSMIIMGVSLLTSMACGSLLHNKVDTIKNVSSSQGIVALKDNSNVSGRFYLGSGYVQGDPYYYYLVEGSNGLDMKKIKTDECSLQFDENPRIETITYEFKNPKLDWIALDATTDYIIYCPEGTVDYSYQVDLK